MDGNYGKVLFTALDAQGDEVWLVRLSDTRWGILVNGQVSAVGWPDGELAPATRAYRQMISLTAHLLNTSSLRE
jgi:hypothetical protein